MLVKYEGADNEMKHPQKSFLGIFLDVTWFLNMILVKLKSGSFMDLCYKTD